MELELALGFNDVVDDGQVGTRGGAQPAGQSSEATLVDGLVELGLGGVTALDRFENGASRRGCRDVSKLLMA